MSAIARLFEAAPVGQAARAVAQTYREAERTVPITDPRVAAARTSALGAVEVAVTAAAWADERFRCAEFASRAARSVAACWERMDGPDAHEQAHARCADRVRARIEARHVAPWVPTR